MSQPPPPAPSIEECLATIASCGNPAAVDAARSLVQAVLGMHRLALARMMELMQRRPGFDPTLLDELAQDDLVANLLLLHDLHPLGLERRLAAAIAEAAPRLAELGGRIDHYTVAEGVIDVRVVGLETSPATMAARLIVEELVVKHAPDAAGLKFTGTVTPRDPGIHGQGQGLITLRIPQAARQDPV